MHACRTRAHATRRRHTRAHASTLLPGWPAGACWRFGVPSTRQRPGCNPIQRQSATCNTGCRSRVWTGLRALVETSCPSHLSDLPHLSDRMRPAHRRACASALCAVLLVHIGGGAAALAAPDAGCTLALAAGQLQSFSHCALIDRVGKTFHLLWETEAAAGDPTVSQRQAAAAPPAAAPAPPLRPASRTCAVQTACPLWSALLLLWCSCAAWLSAPEAQCCVAARPQQAMPRWASNNSRAGTDAVQQPCNKATLLPGPPMQRLVLTIGMNATSSGYVSVGFPSQAGMMTDATAMILQVRCRGMAAAG